MGLFEQLFSHGHDKDMPALLPAIERAVSIVEPMLRQSKGYPALYHKPVACALEYARSLASALPGPVEINRESYAREAFVHALFPSVDYITDAFASSVAVQDYYREFPDTRELCALMGMRRFEKNIMGMELSGEVMHRDVIQKVVYFTSHTIENPAPTEKLAREKVALSFFDSLAGKVKKRVEARKQDWQLQLQEKDSLASRLRAADAHTRPALEKEFSNKVAQMQSIASLMDWSHYIEDFEEVLLNPEQYLRLNRIPMVLDSMGIKQEGIEASQQDAILFNELIDFDRRDWTVTMVYGDKPNSELLAANLDKAYRKLAI